MLCLILENVSDGSGFICVLPVELFVFQLHPYHKVQGSRARLKKNVPIVYQIPKKEDTNDQKIIQGE